MKSSNRYSPLLFSVVLILLTTGMVITIAQYVTFEKTVGFLLFKQDLITNTFWLSIFYIHVFTCIICLLAGLTQFSKDILSSNPKLHRLMGKIYVYNVLFVNFPAGLILAIYANGHVPGKIAFSLLAILWFYFTLAALLAIRRGYVRVHKKQMIRSYSLTLTALTLRLLKIITSKFTDWSYDEIYIFDAWGALSINLLIAEIIIYFKFQRSKRKLITSK